MDDGQLPMFELGRGLPGVPQSKFEVVARGDVSTETHFVFEVVPFFKAQRKYSQAVNVKVAKELFIPHFARLNKDSTAEEVELCRQTIVGLLKDVAGASELSLADDWRSGVEVRPTSSKNKFFFLDRATLKEVHALCVQCGQRSEHSLIVKTVPVTPGSPAKGNPAAVPDADDLKVLLSTEKRLKKKLKKRFPAATKAFWMCYAQEMVQFQKKGGKVVWKKKQLKYPSLSLLKAYNVGSCAAIAEGLRTSDRCFHYTALLSPAECVAVHRYVLRIRMRERSDPAIQVSADRLSAIVESASRMRDTEHSDTPDPSGEGRRRTPRSPVFPTGMVSSSSEGESDTFSDSVEVDSEGFQDEFAHSDMSMEL
ncbi:hypothetical protein KIPB_012351 [Kipferlia bialata]|uniref:Uncharacterized protein n=1 Tax=Kipferlia bialata TaxID=797122 RepID=A0A391NXM7_9EUKA|nr:hypothetical protein KIPB_012351 [Kipferlia bialata]|eukprot:g12351.t1